MRRTGGGSVICRSVFRKNTITLGQRRVVLPKPEMQKKIEYAKEVATERSGKISLNKDWPETSNSGSTSLMLCFDFNIDPNRRSIRPADLLATNGGSYCAGICARSRRKCYETRTLVISLLSSAYVLVKSTSTNFREEINYEHTTVRVKTTLVWDEQLKCKQCWTKLIRRRINDIDLWKAKEKDAFVKT